MNKYFQRKEFQCKCGDCPCNTVDADLLDILTALRIHFKKPIHISSAHRCRQHNAAVGGAPNSQHLLGKAADIVVEGVDPEIVYQTLDAMYQDTCGIGSYDTFTHIDSRSYRSRW